MKKGFIITIVAIVAALAGPAQVTRINNNSSLYLVTPLNSIKTLFASGVDNTLWVSEGTPASTIQLAADITYEGGGVMLGDKFIFSGIRASTGEELYITDGTPGGTMLVKDIYNGIGGSVPADFTVMNGFVYFTATSVAEGRELWRSNGTELGTTLVKDINAGTANSNLPDAYNMFSTGSYLLFAAKGTIDGVELWKSDGTSGGTLQLKDINPGTDSSNPERFHAINNVVLFTAKTQTNGIEVWRTDGTEGGTTLLKDINAGPGTSTDIELMPGFSFPLLLGFHNFNGRAYFNATDGTNNGAVWSTDGTVANTTLLKNLLPGSFLPFILLFDAVDLPSKFIFPVSDGEFITELWQSDGTPGGTSLFKSFVAPQSGDLAYIFLNYSIDMNMPGQLLFQGDKFFFAAAGSASEGIELWISDGTLPNTKMVKDIWPGSSSSLETTAYIYASTALFFAANNGTVGNELWKTDGNSITTSLVKDININLAVNNANADPDLEIINNGKIFFSATDGDDATKRDLFVVDGTFSPLPVKLIDFSVIRAGNDALLKWNTSQESNTNYFAVERSYDAKTFEQIGKVHAAGTTIDKRSYTYTDAGITASGKTTLYYRLATVDNDGNKEFSGIRSIRLKAETWNVQLLGNSPGSPLTFAITGAKGDIQVTLNDMSGKLILSKKFTANSAAPLAISAGNLPRGVYVLTVINDNEKKSVRFVR